MSDIINHGKPWTADEIKQWERAEARVRELEEERDQAKTPCPDCGMPRHWCRRVTSNPAHCWRWDYEQFDRAEARVRELEDALRRIATDDHWPGLIARETLHSREKPDDLVQVTECAYCGTNRPSSMATRYSGWICSVCKRMNPWTSREESATSPFESYGEDAQEEQARRRLR